jgi:hypothetical protein
MLLAAVFAVFGASYFVLPLWTTIIWRSMVAEYESANHRKAQIPSSSEYSSALAVLLLFFRVCRAGATNPKKEGLDLGCVTPGGASLARGYYLAVPPGLQKQDCHAASVSTCAEFETLNGLRQLCLVRSDHVLNYRNRRNRFGADGVVE